MEPHKHLRRLERVFPPSPVYFVTVVHASRSPILACREFQEICEEVWTHSDDLHGWSTGPYVIMPDHVHFFCRESAESARALGAFVGRWKEWTAKHAKRRLGFATPLWQREFFDRLVRTRESLGERIDYLWFNPVRAGLVEEPEDWGFRGNPGGWGAV